MIMRNKSFQPAKTNEMHFANKRRAKRAELNDGVVLRDQQPLKK